MSYKIPYTILVHLGVFILLCAEFYTALNDFIIPSLTSDEVARRITDFALYYDAVNRLLDDPNLLYLEKSKTTLWGFLYPPGSVMLFYPFTYLSLGVAYLVFMMISYAVFALSIQFWIRHCSDCGLMFSPYEKHLFLILCLASGPVYQNALLGQVNVLVLASCIGYVTLLHNRRAILAGLILSLGILLKIYPIILWLLALRGRSAAISVLSSIVSLVLLVLFFHFVIPLSIYKYYLFEFIPEISQFTVTNIINQSTIGFLSRLTLPFTSAFSWGPAYLVPSWVRLSNVVLCIGASLVLVPLFKFRDNEPGSVIAEASLLSFMPMFSPLGWGHVYVLAMPMFLVAGLYAIRGYVQTRYTSLVVLLFFGMFIPIYHHFRILDPIPDVLQNLLYSRYLIAVLILNCIVVTIGLLNGTHHPVKPSKSR
jgi:hypothetical protein